MSSPYLKKREVFLRLEIFFLRDRTKINQQNRRKCLHIVDVDESRKSLTEGKIEFLA